jgi:hypothetical protein
MLHGTGLARHHSTELSRMLDALQAEYGRVRNDVYWGAGPSSMHFCYYNEEHGHSRSLLLDCTRPGNDGSLVGYTPATFMTNTFAKAWPKAELLAGRLSSQEPLIHAKLSDPGILGAVLELLDGQDMLNAMLTNRRWKNIIESAADFKDKKKKQIEIMNMHQNLSSESSNDSIFSGGGWRGVDDYTGYGSN